MSGDNQERNPVKKTISSLLILGTLTLAGCQSEQPAAGSTPDGYQVAYQKAVEWQEKKVFGLAEAEVRKALAVRKDDLEARYLLFESLRAQPEDEAKLNEARNLAEALVGQVKEGSERAQALQGYLDELASQERFKELAESVKKGDKGAKALLDGVAEEDRNGEYWRLSYLYYKDQADLKRTAEVASEWMKHKPTGLEAKDAENLAKEYEMGLFEGPDKALAGFLKAPESERSRFLRDGKVSTNLLDRVFAKSKVKSSKVSGKTAEVVLTCTNPYSGKAESRKLTFPYVQQDGRWYLDLARVDLGSVSDLLGDPQHPLTDTLDGIKGIAENPSRATPESLGAKLGKGVQVPLSKMDENQFWRHRQYGDITVRFEQFKDEWRANQMTVFGPTYRTTEGLGVGNHLSDFRKHYGVKKGLAYPGYGNLTFHTLDGSTRKYGLAVAFKKGQPMKGITLMLDSSDVVIAMQFLSFNYAQGVR